MSWRNAIWSLERYPSCDVIHLSEGALLYFSASDPAYITEASYRMNCYLGRIPYFNTESGKTEAYRGYSLPIVAESWHDFTSKNSKGSFEYSVVPVIYSISALFVITWLLTLFVLTNYTIKPSLLLKSSTILSSVFLLIVIVRAIYALHVQQGLEFLSGTLLLDTLNSAVYLNVIDFIAVILLQINQVQVIMRLFSRQKDKRLTLAAGGITCLSSQIIWAIAKFYKFKVNSETGDILPTFIYLTRTAMAICYAALITVFLMLKIKIILEHRRIWLLTLFTFVVIYGPVAFFVADVANAFVYELSEIFSVVTYVICVVIPWEWCNKFNMIMRAKEKEGILGRRFYEDELYELDGLDLFVEQEDTDNDNDDNTPGEIPGDGSQGIDSRRRRKKYISLNKHNQHLKANKLSTAFDKTKHMFINAADTIIATGFAIPRSASVATSSPYLNSNKKPRNTPSNVGTTDNARNYSNEGGSGNPTNSNQETVIEPDNNARHRRDIYVYSTKQVAIEFSDNDD